MINIRYVAGRRHTGRCTTNTQEINELIGDIRSESEEGSVYDALEWAQDLPAELAEAITAGIIRQHGIEDCKICGGDGGWSGRDWRGMDVDADCPCCDCKGFTTKKDREAWEEWEKKERLREEQWAAEDYAPDYLPF